MPVFRLTIVDGPYARPGPKVENSFGSPMTRIECQFAVKAHQPDVVLQVCKGRELRSAGKGPKGLL